MAKHLCSHIAELNTEGIVVVTFSKKAQICLDVTCKGFAVHGNFVCEHFVLHNALEEPTPQSLASEHSSPLEANVSLDEGEHLLR
jgi:hypothetical protein